ncbi:MAG: ferrous iron transport protein B [Myxococcota bacterium]
MRVAVAGNPNAGKSTLFNALTGARVKVGNYAGVTVERKEANATLPSGRTVRLIDLPGCYSLTARSPEEELAHDVLVGLRGEAKADVIVCVVDATEMSRGLYLVEQLKEMRIPVVMALNMIDVAASRGLHINTTALAEHLGIHVVSVCARRNQGIAELLATLDTGPVYSTLAPVWDLSDEDMQCVLQVAQAIESHGQEATVGESLWLLTSDLDNINVSHLNPQVLQAVKQSPLYAVPANRLAFNRRVIEARYRRVDKNLQGVLDVGPPPEDRRTQRIDRLLLHPIWGMVIFSVMMFVLFQAVFAWAEPMIGAVETVMGWLSMGLESWLPAGLLRSLLVNGVVAGVGNIIVFLPQIALLFLGIAILEESGYLARVAFLLDQLMRRVGLHGKAFIPLMSSFACAVPGVMAARTMESSRARLATIFIAPLMSCSARLPVYVLVIAAVFSATPPILGVLSLGGLVIAAMYLLGFAAALLTAWLLNRTWLKASTPALVLALPTYQTPSPKAVLRQVFMRCRVFVSQTGTIILALSVLMWGLMTFPQEGIAPHLYAQRVEAIQAASYDTSEQAAAMAQLEREDRSVRLRNSFAGHVGHWLEPVIAPLGFDWRIGIGLVASFAAREILVSTLGQVYALDSDVAADSPALRDALLANINPETGKPRFTPLVGLSLMVFFVLAMQCLSTVATVKRETNSWRWPLAQLVYMNTLAYLASLIVYQGGQALGFQ